MESTKEFNIKEVLELTMNNCNYYYNKEEGFRIDVINAIRTLYSDSFIMCEYNVDNNKSIDIVVSCGKKKYAIELKYRACRNRNESQYEFNEKIGEYRIGKASQKYKYIEDIKTRVLDRNVKRNFDGVFAIILTNYNGFISKDKIIEFSEKSKRNISLSKEDCEKIKFNKIKIKNGYYRDKDFYIMCAESKTEIID